VPRVRPVVQPDQRFGHSSRLTFLALIGYNRFMGLVATIRQYCHPGATSPVLRESSVSVERGQVACVFGLSGSGKTTLIRILLGTAPGRLDGNVELAVNSERLGTRAMSARGAIGLITQGSDLVPWLHIRENIALPARLNRKLRPPSADVIHALLAQLNVPDSVLERFPHQLSYGQRHRIAFVRAVAYSPRVLLLDEMFTGLDCANAADLADAIARYVQDSAAHCLLVTHSIEQAFCIGHVFYYISGSGMIERLAEGTTPAEVTRRMRDDLPCLDGFSHQGILLRGIP
jgi:NitT/TauT family transport system ATP-binding protein